jgi:ATP-dependent DNA helicase RecG
MDTNHLEDLLQELINLPHETEWVEFKRNNSNPDDIGEYLSALSNSAALHGKQTAYMVWGLEDGSHNIVGTNFKPRQEKVGGQELESWLAIYLSPRINFKIYEFSFRDKNIVIFEVPRATHTPVRFKITEYIRVGSYKKKLAEFPEKERELWALFSSKPFEKGIALENVTADDVLRYMNYPAYFELTLKNLPDNRVGILQQLAAEKLIVRKPVIVSTSPISVEFSLQKT